eukprot:scaffold2026_cov78-Cylindrotheca_fusiformis.AAC.9
MVRAVSTTNYSVMDHVSYMQAIWLRLARNYVRISFGLIVFPDSTSMFFSLVQVSRRFLGTTAAGQ